ncbi:MAG: hypothetical protein HOH43_10720 [Candidatus Latescibacteria bacterium]|jgi:hypothetical protein|nr:hypothetical protein [Candidatus Latescibacterota bacterium]
MGNVEKHFKVLVVLYIVGGVLFIFPALILSGAETIPGIISVDRKVFLVLSTVGSAVVFLLIALAMPGYYLLHRLQWARNLLIVPAAIYHTQIAYWYGSRNLSLVGSTK